LRIASSVPLLLLALCVPAHATDLGNHAKVGALLGKDCDDATQAFLTGFASHIALDYVIYGTTLYSDGETYNSDYLVPTLVANVVQLRQVYKQYKRTKDTKLLHGALGAILPDLVDMVYHGLLDKEGYVFGWHGRRSTLLIDEPPNVHASRRAAQYNLLIGATLWSVKF
jgi:hypothetical protein